MQEIVAENINNLDYLKLTLAELIRTIKTNMDKSKIQSNTIEEQEKNKEEYLKNMETLKDFESILAKLKSLISIDNIIYNEEKKDKIYYPAKNVLKYLLILKERNNLPLTVTVEELNAYINTVRNSLRNPKHYEDDKVIDEILSFKVYENPHNYDIKNVTELPPITLEDLCEQDKLTEREEEAFFGSKGKKYVRRTGVRKNV